MWPGLLHSDLSARSARGTTRSQSPGPSRSPHAPHVGTILQQQQQQQPPPTQQRQQPQQQQRPPRFQLQPQPQLFHQRQQPPPGVVPPQTLMMPRGPAQGTPTRPAPLSVNDWPSLPLALAGVMPQGPGPALCHPGEVVMSSPRAMGAGDKWGEGSGPSFSQRQQVSPEQLVQGKLLQQTQQPFLQQEQQPFPQSDQFHLHSSLPPQGSQDQTPFQQQQQQQQESRQKEPLGWQLPQQQQ
ncbi:unnamed protein product, partial [Laminaria digitata]